MRGDRGGHLDHAGDLLRRAAQVDVPDRSVRGHAVFFSAAMRSATMRSVEEGSSPEDDFSEQLMAKAVRDIA